MIAFIIPIKPKRFSSNWAQDSLLLQRTIASIIKQNDQRFKVFIVYSDMPDVTVFHHSIHWVLFDYPFIETSDIEDYDSYGAKWYGPDYARKMLDKGRKITLGCKHAMETGCDYLMAVDSDDLVSDRIAKFVNDANKDSSGWVVKKGFMHIENTRFLIKNKQI